MTWIVSWVAAQWTGLAAGVTLVGVIGFLVKPALDYVVHAAKVRRETAAHAQRTVHEQAIRQQDDVLRIAREQAARQEDDVLRIAREQAARQQDEELRIARESDAQRQQEAERIEAAWKVLRRCEGRLCRGRCEQPEWFFQDRDTPHQRLDYLPSQRICRACRSSDGVLGEIRPLPGECEADFELRMAQWYEVIAADRDKGRLAAQEREAERRAEREGGDGQK